MRVGDVDGCVCVLEGVWGLLGYVRDPTPVHRFHNNKNHREYKAALDLARLYMADNSTARRPAAPAEAEEGGGGGGGGNQRVMELTPQEMQREKLAKALKERKQAAAQQQQQEEEGEADPAMVEHRFGSGGACVSVFVMLTCMTGWVGGWVGWQTAHHPANHPTHLLGREKMLAVAALLPKGSGERLSLLKGVARWAAEETGQAVPELGLLLELAEAYKEVGEEGCSSSCCAALCGALTHACLFYSTPFYSTPLRSALCCSVTHPVLLQTPPTPGRRLRARGPTPLPSRRHLLLILRHHRRPPSPRRHRLRRPAGRVEPKGLHRGGRPVPRPRDLAHRRCPRAFFF